MILGSGTMVALMLCIWCGSSLAAEACVSRSGACFATLGQALEESRNGDTITLSKGTFQGGVEVEKSVRLVGAGRRSTMISGGGPVITIGKLLGHAPELVTIERLTVTDGVTTSSAVGPEQARGGGIWIPPRPHFQEGATVKLDDVLITGNRAEPGTSRGPESKTEAKSWPACPEGPCPFALADGGGIENWGTLTLNDSEVSENYVGGQASDADGAGISSFAGSVTIDNSRIADNAAVAAPPNGRFAEGAGVFLDRSAIEVSDSSISGNSAVVTSEFPATASGMPIEMNANSGALHAGDDTSLTISDSRLVGNSVSASDPEGEPLAIGAAVLAEGPASVTETTVRDNSVRSEGQKSSEPGGGVIEFDAGGHVDGLRLLDNSDSVIATEGPAEVDGALTVFTFEGEPQPVTVAGSVIAHNSIFAASPEYGVAQGAGVFNNSLLNISDTKIDANSATVEAPSGAAQGGGIWNGVELSGPPVELALEASTVEHNKLLAGAGDVSLEGGGLFTTLPVSIVATTIARNRPDDCEGCGSTEATLMRAHAQVARGDRGSRSRAG